ncbi:hypothetical protein [Luteimonas salinilitoris]
MNVRILVSICLLAFPFASNVQCAEPDDAAEAAEPATAHAERITDTGAYIAEIEDSLVLARNGDYGRLKRGSMGRLESSRDRIVDLLDGHESARELPTEDRIALYKAQEQISSILRNNDKDRVVCKRITTTGSRVPVNECLTVAEREVRAQVARENTEKLIRNVCTPGEGQSCD